MKYSKLGTYFCAVLIFFLLAISSLPAVSYTGNEQIGLIIEDLDAIKEKVYQSASSDWKKPAETRKSVLTIKLNTLEKQLIVGDFGEALDKFSDDIEPKLTSLWVINENLQDEFAPLCNSISLKLEALLNPDIYPPTIVLTPGMLVTDGDIVGGLLVEWQVTDDGGLSTVIVKLNDNILTSYSDVATAQDSYLLDNNLGIFTFEVMATDYSGHSSISDSVFAITDDDSTAPSVSLVYYGGYTDLDPGYWSVIIDDQESGIGDVQILVNGEVTFQETLNGLPSINYEVDMPAVIGIYWVSVTVNNYDTDRNGDQESFSISNSVVLEPGGSDDDPIIIGV